MDGIIIDSFAGGGGASTGIFQATGRSPDIAINHCDVALGMHAANHPQTEHLIENVWKVNIERYTKNGDVALLWASPDCRHFSKARGGAPTSSSVRGLAWSVVRFVRDLKQKAPLMIGLENVEEFLTWEDFAAWKKELKRLGYKIEHRLLKACDYGVPTIRKRLFIFMRRDGKKINWPVPTHGDPKSAAVKNGVLKPYRTAAEIIDWSIPCPSIFDTKEEIKEKHSLRAIRPLSDKTLKRIASGIVKFILDAKEPFFVTLGQHGGSNRSALDPMHTICASRKDQNAVVMPTMVQVGYGERKGQAPRVLDIQKPLGTVVAGGCKAALVTAFIAQHNTGAIGRAAQAPLSTITVRGTQQTIIAASMINLKGTGDSARSCREPVNTITARGTHVGLVSAFLIKYYGAGVGQHITEPLHTITTKDRYGLVTIDIGDDQYIITDIGMRMLTPRELFLAQGFPADYKIDSTDDGEPINKTQQVHKCGNSVPPGMVKAVIGANWGTSGSLGTVDALNNEVAA